MKTILIKELDNLYSIREDGQVISHRTIGKPTNILTRRLFKNMLCVRILCPNNKRKDISINKLMITYFNKFYCYSCKEFKSIDKNIHNNISKNSFKSCSDCSTRKSDIILSKHGNLYRKIYITSEQSKQYYKHAYNTVNKSWIAKCLSMKTSDLNNDMYHAHKQLVITKRLVAKESGISISSLNVRV